MKRLFLFLIFIIAFSCKNEEKKAQREIINGFENKLFDLSIWKKVWIELDETLLNNKNNTVYTLSRVNVSKPSYVQIQVKNKKNNQAKYGYQASVIVKKKGTDFFGFRMAESYSNRIDAIFDLSKGVVKGVQKVGDLYTNENAIIEDLNDGWYRCSLYGQINALNFYLYFAPTSGDKNVVNWEGKTETLNDIYIYPKSLNVQTVKRNKE